MTRSGYSEDMDNDWALICYRGAVASSIRGKRGQAFLAEMLGALDALGEKRLITNELEASGEVCAIGAVGKKRGMDMSRLDPYDAETIAKTFDIAQSLAREIVYLNDEWALKVETPEDRFNRMRAWVVFQLSKAETVS